MPLSADLAGAPGPRLQARRRRGRRHPRGIGRRDTRPAAAARPRAPILQRAAAAGGRVNPALLQAVEAEAQIDLARAEQAARDLLIALGEDPDRDGLRDTPR